MTLDVNMHSVRTVQNLLGFAVIDEAVSELSRTLIGALPTLAAANYICLNPHSYITSIDDPEFAEALHNAHGLICDGIGISLAARILLGRRLRRITGFELFRWLSSRLSDRGNGRVYFLGGHPDWSERLLARYRREFPGIVHIRHLSPPFKRQFDRTDIAAMAGDIQAFGPEILWIGLGSPKQEKVALALSREGGFSIAVSIGQVFDVYAGRFAQTPLLVRRAGFEWAFRLVRQPHRLGARTFKSAPRFVGHLLRVLLNRDGS